MKTNERKKELGEVFTPPELVDEILEKINQIDNNYWKDDKKTFLDPTCGNGAFLLGVKQKLLSNGHSLDNILSRVYGVDIMEDNCIETISELYEVDESSIEIKKYNSTNHEYDAGLIAHFYIDGKMTNIVQADGLQYNYEFKQLTANIFNSMFDEI